MPPLVIAHRGASSEAPENTLLAFDRALELGVDGIELDVQVTRDGIPVVFHDFTLTRLTGTRGRLADRTWAQLQQLRVRGEPIPTLAETLSLTRKRALVQIEIKKGAPVAPILAAIRKTASTKHVILASFEPDILRQAATLAPKLPRMLIVDKPKAPIRLTTESTKITEVGRATHRPSPIAHRLLQTMSAIGAAGLSVDHRAITSQIFVETIHRHGAKLWTWVVNDTSTMRRLSSYSVDAILTDDPAKLLKVLRE
jgi:glycerophosphoryl diester phosphodiesterase